jgi:hypothetical protein
MGKERPILVAIITTMGVVIAALITSGYFTRSSAAKREDVLEERVRTLETELRKQANNSRMAAPASEVIHNSGVDPGQAPDLNELVAELARQKNTQILGAGKSVKGVIAADATKEYVFIGNGNVPLLFTLDQPVKGFWAEVDILSSQGTTVLRGQGFYNSNTQFSFTPPKNDVYVFKLKGTGNFGDFVVEVAPLSDARAK